MYDRAEGEWKIYCVGVDGHAAGYLEGSRLSRLDNRKWTVNRKADGAWQDIVRMIDDLGARYFLIDRFPPGPRESFSDRDGGRELRPSEARRLIAAGGFDLPDELQTSATGNAAELAAAQSHPAAEPALKPDPIATPTHSGDFTTVNWFGAQYTFDDGLQAKAIKLLWTEFEKGGHGLSEKTIGERIGSAASNYRLASTFRNHPAWGTMIVKVRQGVYRLKNKE